MYAAISGANLSNIFHGLQGARKKSERGLEQGLERSQGRRNDVDALRLLLDLDQGFELLLDLLLEVLDVVVIVGYEEGRAREGLVEERRRDLYAEGPRGSVADRPLVKLVRLPPSNKCSRKFQTKFFLSKSFSEFDKTFPKDFR